MKNGAPIIAVTTPICNSGFISNNLINMSATNNKIAPPIPEGISNFSGL